MKYAIILSFILTCNIAFGQGIDFQKLDWKTNLEQAQKEDKLVYVDFFTTWCAPCTYMAKKFFPDPAVGTFYNKNFYCLKIDAEKEGADLAKQYKVDGYPTNLFINPSNQEIVYKTMGAPGEVEAFIENGRTAVAEFNDPLTLEDYALKMEEGDSSKEFTLKFLKKLTRLDKPNQWPLDVYSHLYFKKKLGSEEFEFMDEYLKDINNNTFEIFKNNKSAYNAFADKKHESYRWEDVLSAKLYATNAAAAANKDGKLYRRCVVTAKELLPENKVLGTTYFLTKKFYENHDSTRAVLNEYDYANKLVAAPKSFYKDNNQEMLASVMKQLEWQSKEWPATMVEKLDSIKNAYSQEKQYSQRMTAMAAEHLNSQAWFVFENDPDRNPEALIWAEKAYEMAKTIERAEAATADTYANLLFVNGNKKKAIAIETEAIKKAKELGEDITSYEKTLAKFEK